jgi:hypothetical protein
MSDAYHCRGGAGALHSEKEMTKQSAAPVVRREYQMTRPLCGRVPS